MSERFVLVTGCSGGGKSSLLAELDARGLSTVEEPGRRIVMQEIQSGGRALPWIDGAAFARRAIDMALSDRQRAQALPGWVFFDRGLIDAASALEAETGERVLNDLARQHRYHRQVFLAPPWPEIYQTDPERRHGFEDGLAEFSRLAQLLPDLGYEVINLPKVSVQARADLVVETLGQAPSQKG